MCIDKGIRYFSKLRYSWDNKYLEKYKDLFIKYKINIENPTTVGYYDNCFEGEKTKQIFKNIVFNFYPDKLSMTWRDPNMILLCDIIQGELNFMKYLVDDNYSCQFVFNDIIYTELSNDLIENILKCGCGNGVFLINNNLGFFRSQIMVYESDQYGKTDNNYLLSEIKSFKR